ncbi:MAG: sulfatase-like hydrolase/transferase [Acetobacteraceae bacterium]
MIGHGAVRLIYLLFDSLNRRSLGCYGGNSVPTPNFDALAARSLVFDNHYVGSLPCMPARRDMQTGRLNFLHRGWGPLEPFDNAFPDLLRSRGVYSHLITDHYHYFEEGGIGHHGRYSSWEFFRGQEKDKWKGVVEPPLERLRAEFHPSQFDPDRGPNSALPYAITRQYIHTEEQFPLAQCFTAALEFLETNGSADNWVLQIECFDPHEPFFAAERYRAGLAAAYQGPVLDWPRYGRPDYLLAEQAELRANYAALVAMCDAHLGRLIAWLDGTGAWHNTAIILSTDHGLLLGEHEYWGKNRPPFFNEIAHIPLLFHHPDGVPDHRLALTQTIDLMPTILDLFGVPIPPEVRGHSLLPLLAADRALRSAVLFGQFGGATNITDGRFAWLVYPPSDAPDPLFHYTLMPMHMRSFFEPAELAAATLHPPFDFTHGMPVLKIPVLTEASGDMQRRYPLLDAHTVLYDLVEDPGQTAPLAADFREEARLSQLVSAIMRAHDAPPEAYLRLRLALS